MGVSVLVILIGMLHLCAIVVSPAIGLGPRAGLFQYGRWPELPTNQEVRRGHRWRIKYPDSENIIISFLIHHQDNNRWSVCNPSALPARFSIKNYENQNVILDNALIKPTQVIRTEIMGDTPLLVDIHSWERPL
ncbi:hypothetical protein PCANC_21424 [Puccinia coronata f. sp. avenae]|uniref:Uncharacterized protein n=1 Tax=Puccinia coronata f. sp. avenae TaxID=200324 RepID=A0A2N5RZN0_9BASI|nr:hypothetical protein PCANC_21424 [Puccinia coronata f. sp. avenae]